MRRKRVSKLFSWLSNFHSEFCGFCSSKYFTVYKSNGDHVPASGAKEVVLREAKEVALRECFPERSVTEALKRYGCFSFSSKFQISICENSRFDLRKGSSLGTALHNWKCNTEMKSCSNSVKSKTRNRGSKSVLPNSTTIIIVSEISQWNLCSMMQNCTIGAMREKVARSGRCLELF